jgi:hypothetical protein
VGPSEPRSTCRGTHRHAADSCIIWSSTIYTTGANHLCAFVFDAACQTTAA